MSTLRVNTIQDTAGSGSPAINGLARAWVNFNGTGTVAIRAASNVSSITDGGTGTYTVNFTTAMPDANYAVTVGLSDSSWGSAHYLTSFATTSFGVWTGFNAGTSAADLSSVLLTIHR